ncbi:two-component histidine kinase CseC [Kineosphaera limosa NBRC 100340]|uniref:histidine kinase n=1 Tax=Kineosphaera limosa NBRC 100340 TaxID=1184609 RepID=K6WUI8_9MICO|nr:two-component histidine kinase CseC [Kineosphaera limosa NBRC 100340]
MRRWHSLRVRIAAGVAVVAISVSLMIGLVVDRAAATDGRERLRAQALDRLDAAVAFYDGRGVLRFGAALNDQSLPPAVGNVGADSQVSWYDGTSMYAAQRLDERHVLSVTLPGDELASQRTALRWAWAQAAAIGAAISAVLGWLVGTWLSRRLRAGAAAAAAIASGDTQRRAAQPGGDEVALLTVALDRMASALQRRLQIERHFTADVAHELRSPVTGLVSAAELLPRDDVSDLVRRQVARLRRLVEDLLEISRIDAPDSTIDWQDCDLRAVVTACLQHEHDRVEVEVLADAVVRAEPRRIERVVTNLVRNALTYGAPPVRVVVDGPTVTVADAGPGYPEELLQEGPRRFATYTRGKGSGLGLTIAVKHTEAMGGSLALSNRPEGGARAVLVLRAATTAPPLAADDEHEEQ